MDTPRPQRWGVAGDVNVTPHTPPHTTTLPNLLHLCAPPPPLQYALILDNERSLEVEATAEITDPL